MPRHRWLGIEEAQVPHKPSTLTLLYKNVQNNKINQFYFFMKPKVGELKRPYLGLNRRFPRHNSAQ